MQCLICGASHANCDGTAKNPMAIDIPKRRPANEPLWLSSERLYLTAEGQVVGDKDPRKLTLLVAAGNSLPMAEAKRLGLVETKPAKPVATGKAIVKAVAVMQEAGEPDAVELHPEITAALAPAKTEAIRKPQTRGAKRK